MKRSILLAAALVAAALTLAGTASAGAGPGQCGAAGAPLVNVTYRLLHDADSGYGGNAWAMDTIFRHLRIWQVDGGYCAVAQDVGAFTTLAGTSPSGASTVSAGIRGILDGGYRTTVFQGTFAPGSYDTHGYLGAFDLGCDASFVCPGAAPNPAAYFTTTSGLGLDWWGWTYRTARNGTWVNAVDVPAPGAGDVTG